MKHTLLLLLLISFSVFGEGQPQTDAQIAATQLRKLVELAREKDTENLPKFLVKAATPQTRHEATPARVISYLGSIAPAELQFEPARALGDTGIVRVRITAPIRLDLDFQRVVTNGTTSLLLKQIHP